MDSKCRVSVPSNFRSSLQKQSFKGLIAFPSYKGPNIDACGIDRMERISDDLDNNNEYSQEEFDLISLYFGEGGFVSGVSGGGGGSAWLGRQPGC